MDHPSIDEIQKTIKEINTGKASGLDISSWGWQVCRTGLMLFQCHYSKERL